MWPWLVQMGWGRAQWYTARWVDRLLFPNNGPSVEVVIPEFQTLEVGDFIPDGRPANECGFIVHEIDPDRARSCTRQVTCPEPGETGPASTGRGVVLLPIDGGVRTRFLFRSRWVTAPWWLTTGGWLGIVPADFVMARTCCAE